MAYKYLTIVLFFVLSAHAQNRTVYIIKNDSIAKANPTKSKLSILDDLNPFGQFALSAPVRLNPEYGKTNNSNEDEETFFLPDGVSLHAGAGFHIDQTLAFTANTGFDWSIGSKLFSVPMYASAILNLVVADGQSILLQYGFGYNFAIGHGDLSGFYQKYRAGYIFDIIGIFAEINNYGYPWKDAPTMSTLNIGIQVFVFE